MTAHLDDKSGYGIYSAHVAQEFIRRGYKLSIYCPSFAPCQIPNTVKGALSKAHPPLAPQFIIFPCIIQPACLAAFKGPVAYMTMWETTRLTGQRKFSSNPITYMNSCRVVMVPNAWNASCFSANGINTAIRIVPLGIDIDFFAPVPNDLNGKLVFGTAGAIYGGGDRKGFSTVVRAFLEAFPNEKDVVLKIKCLPNDPAPDTSMDKRIELTKRYLSSTQLKDWYASLNVYASGSAAEGWGLHQHESMAMGRPVIGVNFGGVTEFFNEENGYACDWVFAAADGFYKTMGHFAKPLVRSMAEHMRKAYEDRYSIERKSALALASARRFSIPNSVNKIISVLNEFKIIGA